MKKQKLISIQVRVTKSQKQKLQTNANKYAGGNLSKWLRETGFKYRPKIKR